MARYDPDVMVCQVNPSWVRVPRRVPVHTAERPGAGGVDIVDVDGHPGIAGVRVSRGDHTCSVVLDPPLPDLGSLPPSARRQGATMLQADHTTELRGRYELERAVDRTTLVIDKFGPWRTRQRRPLLAMLFRLPVFRQWPRTYRWQGTLDNTDPAVSTSQLTSRWTRRRT